MISLKLIKRSYQCMYALMIVLGVALLIYPGTTLKTLTRIFGAALIILGIQKILSYFSRDLFQLAFQFDLGLGILNIIIGLAFWIHPISSVEVMGMMVGIFTIVNAVMKIQTAFDAKKFGLRQWPWLLIAAIITCGIGFLLITGSPSIVQAMGGCIIVNALLGFYVIHTTVNLIGGSYDES